MASEVGRSVPVDYVPSDVTINSINEHVSKMVTSKYRHHPERFFTPPKGINTSSLELWRRDEYIQNFRQACFANDSNAYKFMMSIVGSIVTIIAVSAFTSLAITLATTAALLAGVYCLRNRMSRQQREALIPLCREVIYCTQRVWNEGITAANWPPAMSNEAMPPARINIPAQIRNTSISVQQTYWREYSQKYGFTQQYMKDLLLDMAKGNWSSPEVMLYVADMPTAAQ